jgi:hypothetical protein
VTTVSGIQVILSQQLSWSVDIVDEGGMTDIPIIHEIC